MPAEYREEAIALLKPNMVDTFVDDICKIEAELCSGSVMSELSRNDWQKAEHFEKLCSKFQSKNARAKAEVQTLQNSQERTRYTLRKNRENTQRILKLVTEDQENTEKALEYLKSYLKLYGYGDVGVFLSEESKQFQEERDADEKLDEPLLQGDNIFSWLVKKAIAQLRYSLKGDLNAGNKVS